MSITKKQIILSFVLVTLFSACIHVISLVIFVIKTGTLQPLNIFKILAFDLFVPNLGQGMFMLIISWLFYGGLWLVSYIISVLLIKNTDTHRT